MNSAKGTFLAALGVVVFFVHGLSSEPVSQDFTPARLDQLLAPIALYPDTLLGQILTAATYPLEIVQADRWLQQSGNPSLHGDDLAAALEKEPWDVSVKSLVPFPEILTIMDNNLDWTQHLGEAFLSNQAAVMDSVQRLRQSARTAGHLEQTSEQAVSVEENTIKIEPEAPDIVYVPVYNPVVVYETWPYPEYPPYYFPWPVVYVTTGYAVCFTAGYAVGPYWGWGYWDWHHHYYGVHHDRLFRQSRPVIRHRWEHDTRHRHGVVYRDSVVRARFAHADRTDRVHTPTRPDQTKPVRPGAVTRKTNLPVASHMPSAHIPAKDSRTPKPSAREHSDHASADRHETHR